MFLSHGGRPTKGNGRKRKGVNEYAAENPTDFTAESINRDGQMLQVLVCRFCCQSIGARSDRIKEHITSKRHQKLKLEAICKKAEETGAGLEFFMEHNDGDDSFNGGFPGSSNTSMVTQKSEETLFGVDDLEEKDLKPNTDYMYSSNSPHPLQNLPGLLPMFSDVFPGVGGRSSSGESSISVSTSKSLHSSPTKPPEEEPSSRLLCVQWVNYQSNIATMFSKLLKLKHLNDVTLWCEGRTISCHKVILSAGSEYFENLFLELPDKYPIIVLKDIKFWEAESLVEFMYKGIVNIPQGKLPSLLQAAKSLQIKGLCYESDEMANDCSGNETTKDGNK